LRNHELIGRDFVVFCGVDSEPAQKFPGRVVSNETVRVKFPRLELTGSFLSEGHVTLALEILGIKP
jgi:hypothetical protein